MYPGWIYDCEIRYSQNNQILWILPGARVAGMYELHKVGVQKQIGVFWKKGSHTLQFNHLSTPDLQFIMKPYPSFVYFTIIKYEKLYEKI